MYQRTRLILDWIVVFFVYSLVLLIIPISDKLLGHLNADTVDVILNLIINGLIGLVFICLLVYLIKKGKSSPVSSYTWLVVFFIITAYFLAKVKITTDRLHFLGYGILSLFLYRALRHNIATMMLYIYAAIAIMLFAILDEGLQVFGLGGRSFELKDIGIDWLSSLVGQSLIALVVRPKLEAIDIKIRRYVRGLKKMKAFTAMHRQGFGRSDLDTLAVKICLSFKKYTGRDGGHVHFMYKGKEEHLILFCHNQKLEQIVAKGRHCKEGEYLAWNQSEFSHFSPIGAFLEFLPGIHRIIIDHPSIRKSWNSFDEFQGWLNKAS